MLSNTSVVVGTNLAEIFVERGVKLVPKQSTLLLELSSAISNNLFSKIENRDLVETSILHASSGNEVVNKGVKSYSHSVHDTIMDNYIEELTTIVSNHVSFARNTVNKEVTKLIEAIQGALSSYKYQDPEDFFNVSYFKLHDVFRSFIIDSEISSYKGSTVKFFFEPINLTPVVTAEDFDLASYILTGDEEQDSLILSWFNELGKEKAVHYLVNNIPEYSLSVKALLDFSLINYLFYRNLHNKTDLNVGLSSIQLRSRSASNRDYFGNKLGVAIEFYHRDVRNGVIFTTDSNTSFSIFNTRKLDITIYEESFTKLAEGGGSIEVIFGYISSEGKVDVTVDKLLANLDKYVSNWRNTRSMYLVYLNNSKLDIFKQLVAQKFEESLSDLTEAEKTDGFSSVDYVEATKKLAKEYIDSLELSEIDNIDLIALELVARIRFRFSNAYFILKEMHEIMLMNDDIQPLEAALYATIKYVTDFLIEQLDAVRF